MNQENFRKTFSKGENRQFLPEHDAINTSSGKGT